MKSKAREVIVMRDKLWDELQDGKKSGQGSKILGSSLYIWLNFRTSREFSKIDFGVYSQIFRFRGTRIKCKIKTSKQNLTKIDLDHRLSVHRFHLQEWKQFSHRIFAFTYQETRGKQASGHLSLSWFHKSISWKFHFKKESPQLSEQAKPLVLQALSDCDV